MKAVKDSFHNFVTLLAKYPLVLISSIIVTRFLGPENKGVYVYLIMMSNVILPISFLGLGNGIQYYISRNSYKVKDVSLSTGLVGFLTGILVSLLILFLWHFEIFGAAGNSAKIQVLMPFLIIIPFDGIIYAIRFLLIGDSKFKLYNNIFISFQVLSTIIIISFILSFKDKLLAAAMAFSIGKLLYLIITLYFFLKIYEITLRFDFKYLKETYLYGLKSWLGNVSSRANDQLDQLIIGAFVSPAQLGIYSVSYAVVNLLLIPSNALSPVLFNELSKIKSIQKSSKIASQIHRSLFLSMLIIAVILGITAYWLIPLMYGSDFSNAYLPFLILLPGILLYSVSRRVLQKFLAANGLPLKTSFVQMIGAVVGAISYILLIPSYGIIGGAIGSTLAYIASTITAYFISKKLIQGKFGFFSFSIKDLKWISNKIIKLLPLQQKRI